MPHILALASVIPPHRLEQSFARREMARLCEGQPHLERLLPVFDRAGVDTRHLVRPPEWYLEPRTFEERNEEYATQALALAAQAARQCLEQSGTAPDQLDHIYFVTTTGLATPSLDALLAGCLGLRVDVRRSPLFGLGCAGGAGALVRACDVLTARPRERALVVSVELGSLIFSTRAQTPTDLVGVALFGDGCAAAVLGGDETVSSNSIRVVATRSRLFPDARHLMGWRFTSDGMRLVLSRDIPSLVRERVAPVVTDFLRDADMSVQDITHYILHPGGPKVMATYRSAFGLSDDALSIARECMRQYGNLSSAAVLVMLSHLVASGRPVRGDTGLLMALGPGFAAEMLALSW
jgi:alkylresorcinol/alkylpyrone synthase